MDLSVGRLLTLLELLQAHRRLSAQDIAGRLEVDPRTVRRYIAGLQEMGIPVEGERGRAGGYRLRAGYKLPPLMFSDDEAMAVVLGLLAVQRMGLVRDSRPLTGALAKLDRVLPEASRKRLAAMQEMLALQLRPARTAATAEVLLTMSSAARDQARVKISYRAADGTVTERKIDPYGIAFQSGAWYVVGHDHLRNDRRTFRLDRVQEAEELSKEAFEKPDDFDVISHVQRMLATIPYGWTAEVVLHARPAEARKRIAPALGTVETTEAGEALLKIGAEDLDWLARYLAELPFEFTVLEPAELKVAVRKQAERLQRGAQ